MNHRLYPVVLLLTGCAVTGQAPNAVCEPMSPQATERLRLRLLAAEAELAPGRVVMGTESLHDGVVRRRIASTALLVRRDVHIETFRRAHEVCAIPRAAPGSPPVFAPDRQTPP